MRLREEAYSEANEETRLAHTGVADKDELEEVVTLPIKDGSLTNLASFLKF